jgi:hypothetical protein
MSVHSVADQGANIFNSPGRDPRAQFDRPGERPGLNFPPQRCGGKWEDRLNQLGLADVARFGQRADRMGIVWHVAELHEARLHVTECTQLDRQVAIANGLYAIAEGVSLRLPSFPKRRGYVLGGPRWPARRYGRPSGWSRSLSAAPPLTAA